MKATKMINLKKETEYVPVDMIPQAIKLGYEMPEEMNFPVECGWFLDLETNIKTLKPMEWS